MLILKEAASALRRTPIMSVMTAIAIAVSLALCGIFAILAQRANESLEEFRAKLLIEAFFDPSVSSVDASATVDEKVRKLPTITSFSFISKEVALSDYEKNSGEDVLGILGYNPLPASARMTFGGLTSGDAKKIRKQLLSINEIKDVLYDEKSLVELEERSYSLYLLALALGAVFLIVSVTIVASTIRLALGSRRDAIHAMQLLGAHRTTIIIPYILEGGFSGFSGGLFAGGLILLFSFFVLPAIAADLTPNISGAKEYLLLFAATTLAGIIIGMIGSVIAAWRSSGIQMQ